MAALTVASDYGPLGLDPTNGPYPECELPHQKYRDDNVLMVLGPELHHVVVPHIEVLRAACPFLAASLSKRWTGAGPAGLGPLDIKHPDLGEEVPAWCHALKSVDHTLMLEGTAFVPGDANGGVRFVKSALATDGWPTIADGLDEMWVATRSFRIFIALLYNAKLTLDQISGRANGGVSYDYASVGINGTVFRLLVNVCAIAEYMGCLALIGPRVIAILQSCPRYWEAVADEPTQHMMLAVKLENADIYYDALRHMSVQAWLKADWSDIEEIGMYTQAQLHEYFEPQMWVPTEKLLELREELQKLQLKQVSTRYYGGGWHETHTRVLDVKPFSEPAPVDFVGKSMFSEWLTYQLSGERVWRCNTGLRGEPFDRGMPRVIEMLERANGWPNPSGIFGASAVAYFGDMYKFTAEEKNKLRITLNWLVRNACKLIKKAFPVKTALEQTAFQTENELCITRRAHFDAFPSGYSTYLTVPARLPWDSSNLTSVPHNLGAIVPRIDTTLASVEWLTTLIEHYNASAWDAAPKGSTVDDSTVDDSTTEKLTAEDPTAEDLPFENLFLNGSTAEERTAEETTTATAEDGSTEDTTAEATATGISIAESAVADNFSAENATVEDGVPYNAWNTTAGNNVSDNTNDWSPSDYTNNGW